MYIKYIYEKYLMVIFSQNFIFMGHSVYIYFYVYFYLYSDFSDRNEILFLGTNSLFINSVQYIMLAFKILTSAIFLFVTLRLRIKTLWLKQSSFVRENRKN